MLTRLDALEMRSLWDCTKSVFDDSSSCRGKKSFFTTAVVPSWYIHAIYLTEKVRQDLFGQGGRHRAQLHRGEAESGGEHIQILWVDEDQRTFWAAQSIHPRAWMSMLIRTRPSTESALASWGGQEGRGQRDVQGPNHASSGGTLTVNLERMYAPAPTPTPITVRMLRGGQDHYRCAPVSTEDGRLGIAKKKKKTHLKNCRTAGIISAMVSMEGYW